MNNEELQQRPTVWAYERACEAIEKHRARADAAEVAITTLRASNTILRSTRETLTARVATLTEALGHAISSASDGMAKQHLDRSGIFQNPPHGMGVFAECEAPWCKRNQEKLARWIGILSRKE